MNLPPKVSPGQPIKAAYHNQFVDALRQLGGISLTKNGGFQRSRAISRAETPFEITLTQKDGDWCALSTAGKWYGRGNGEAVRGLSPEYPRDSDGNLTDPFPEISDGLYDTFEICACIWRIGPSIANKRLTFFLRSEGVVGGGFLQEHPRIWMIEESAAVDSSFKIEAYTAATLVAVVEVDDKSVPSYRQIIKSDFRYIAAANATSAFTFHRIDGTTNGFCCFGGLLRVLPVRWRGLDFESDTLPREVIPSGLDYDFSCEFYTSVSGTRFSFSEEELDAGVVAFMRVSVQGQSVTTDWILRSLSACGLSSLNYDAASGEIYPHLPEEVQLVRLTDKISEGEANPVATRPGIKAGDTWAACIPMAMFRRIGESKFVDVLTIHKGVVDVRPVIEIQRVVDETPFVDQNCEGAVNPQEPTTETFGAIAGEPQESGSEEISAYGLENDELSGARNFKA